MNSQTPVQLQCVNGSLARSALFYNAPSPSVRPSNWTTCWPLLLSIIIIKWDVATWRRRCQMPSQNHSKRCFKELGLICVKNMCECLQCGSTSAFRHLQRGWQDQSCCCADLHTVGASVKDVWGGRMEDRRWALGCWGITNIIANDTRHCSVIQHARQQRCLLTASKKKALYRAGTNPCCCRCEI